MNGSGGKSSLTLNLTLKYAAPQNDVPLDLNLSAVIERRDVAVLKGEKTYPGSVCPGLDSWQW